MTVTVCETGESLYRTCSGADRKWSQFTSCPARATMCGSLRFGNAPLLKAVTPPAPRPTPPWCCVWYPVGTDKGSHTHEGLHTPRRTLLHEGLHTPRRKHTLLQQKWRDSSQRVTIIQVQTLSLFFSLSLSHRTNLYSHSRINTQSQAD